MNIKKISTMKMLEKLIWGRVDGMELESVQNLFNNVVFSQDNIGTYVNGEPIKLTRQLFNEEWVFVEKHKTLMDAYKYSEANGGMIACMHGDNDIRITSKSGMENVVLYQFLNISLQDLVEDKYWANFIDEERFAVTITDPKEYSDGFPLLVAIDKLLISDSHYFVQYHTGKKIYIDDEGIKDSETKELVELTASLYKDGYWYIGEMIETDGSLTILDALKYIDWNSQELVFGEGTEDEFIIPTKLVYEDIDLKDVLPEEATDVNIKQVFTQTLWKVRNKTL
ncbi:hypothetical protein PQE66_gp103 [Bacillus phage PBC2]|uniref:Uncharacterized protein n=1 Tax=Bacillus phage PBC2 TaxID=1675029 RepID=A0A218KC07_9CAUD|nr:hypothetical protein PQE66_gp103 [Bacillus phage PBC2]AKQ08418.1 hypothetical protein PBC2_103 [Bacillus phage PBC2]